MLGSGARLIVIGVTGRASRRLRYLFRLFLGVYVSAFTLTLLLARSDLALIWFSL